MPQTIKITDILQTRDQTYQINPDKDCVVNIINTEAITEAILADGSLVKGVMTKETIQKTTLGAIKQKIKDLGETIIADNLTIAKYQKELDALKLQLPEIQAAISFAILNWTPLPK